LHGVRPWFLQRRAGVDFFSPILNQWIYRTQTL